MDWLTFAENLAESLAWPLAVAGIVIFVIIYLKQPITELLARIKRFSYKGATLDFGVFEKISDEKVKPEEIDHRTDDAIRNDPRAAVIEAWLRLEWEAERALDSLGVSEESRSPMTVIRSLGRHNLLQGNLYEFFVELRKIRNQAAHELDLTIGSNEARRYVELTEQAIAELRANAKRVRNS